MQIQPHNKLDSLIEALLYNNKNKKTIITLASTQANQSIVQSKTSQQNVCQQVKSTDKHTVCTYN